MVRSGEDGGREAELGASKFIGPITWAAVGSGEGRSVEIGGENMGLGAGVGEEQSGVPHVRVGGRCGYPCRGST